MPVAIRNTYDTTVVLSSRDRSAEAITWTPAGTEGDVQLVSDEMARGNIALIQNVGSGVLAVEEDQANEAAAELLKQAGRFSGRRATAAAPTGLEALVADVQIAGNRDIVIKTADLDAHADRLSKSLPSDFDPLEG